MTGRGAPRGACILALLAGPAPVARADATHSPAAIAAHVAARG